MRDYLKRPIRLRNNEDTAMRSRIPSFACIIPLAAVLLLVAINSTSLAETDSNSDERLKRLLQRAPQADADKDGVLTLKEAQAFLKAHRAKQAERNRARAKPTHADIKYGDHERHVFRSLSG